MPISVIRFSVLSLRSRIILQTLYSVVLVYAFSILFYKLPDPNIHKTQRNLSFLKMFKQVDQGNISENGASFEETIVSLDNKFTQVLIRLLDRICDLGCDNNNEKLLNVFCRLDFNLFYTDILIRRGKDKMTEQQDVSG